jgi:4-amino-4-deoxy-L-arabinose transferase-like glycosyltransferase
MLIFMVLVWCLVVVEAESREPRGSPARLLGLAVLAGVMLGIGSLARYSFAWLLIPVLAFLGLFAGRQRVLAMVLALVAFTMLFTPWLARNYSVSGKFLGTAGYAVYEKSEAFADYSLERSLQPELPRAPVTLIIHKMRSNLPQLVSSDLPQLGGTWLTALFLVGLLVAYHDPAVSRTRYFVVVSLILMCLVQALGRTQLSEDSPQINSENLLVLFAPLLIIYGVSLFYLLLEQVEMPFRELRYAAISLFAIIASLPMILSFFSPHIVPISYPPYYPPALQEAAEKFTKPDELTVSDLPWAMAWYGQRQCAWLNGPADVITINERQNCS